jgi:hypothetical protein
MKTRIECAKVAALACGLLLTSEVRAGDVRGSVRSNDEVKTKTIEAVRSPYWQEWNGFIDPKKASTDYAREVSAVLIGSAATRDATTVVLRDGTLTPSTIVVQHGTPLRIRNDDDFGHELYVEGLKQFDAVATSSGQTRTIQMEQTGVFVVRDKLAPHVRGHLHVIAKITHAVNPSADGSFKFEEVPPGQYTLKLFRNASEVYSNELEVTSTRELVIDPISVAATNAKAGK